MTTTKCAKSIIFSTPMVCAILDGRKTQTRCVINPQPTKPYQSKSFGIPLWRWKDCQWIDNGIGFPQSGIKDHAPYKPGDILWVRETWRLIDFEYVDDDWNASVQLKDGTIGNRLHHLKNGADECIGWRPSIHMTRAAARIHLWVTGVRAERLQDITDADAIAEGIYEVRPGGWFWTDPATTNTPNVTLAHTPRQAYMWLWDKINLKRGYGWATNPWVWAYTFERYTP